MEGLNTAIIPLTITAYASQLYKSAGVEFTAAEAWANAPKGLTPFVSPNLFKYINERKKES